VIRGGLRTRFVVDSARIAIIAALSALGWFEETVHDTPPGPRRHRPLRYVPKPLKWDEMVEPNAIAISTDDAHSLRRGLGGDVEDNIRAYVDIFAESDQLGWHLSQDVRDILIGKMPDVGRSVPAIDVYDLRLATPAPFTQVDVEGPLLDRAESESREWRNRWFMVRFDLIDEYYDDFGDVDIDDTAWTEDYAAVWQQIQEVEQP
jgi:hypothetical protein